MAPRGARLAPRSRPLVRALCRAHSRRGREGSGLRLALGLDAAWTAHNPSGVALVGDNGAGWRLIAAESSYAAFIARAGGRAPGMRPDVPAMLDACRRLAGATPDLVAVDMPLALTPIVGRRASDGAISSAFGAAKAATHSPSQLRPGPLADALRADFAEAGYALCTTRVETPGVMEVYPHAALLRLSGDPVRLTYKAGKSSLYWPGLTLEARGARLREVWRRIVGLLGAHLADAEAALAPPGAEVRGAALKAYEDKLDAVVCAYVAMCALEGRTEVYGDETSAVWVPRAATAP